MRRAIAACVVAAGAAAAQAAIQLSPSGEAILIPDPAHQRMLVCTLAAEECFAVGPTLTGGRLARWSPDGTSVGFKVVVESAAGGRLQAPAILDLARRSVTLLHDPVPLAGNPAFSADGHVAFTVGEELVVVDRRLEPVRSASLPHYVNWVALAPDASVALYNDPSDTVVSLDLSTGERRRVSAAGAPSCRPMLSPDGSRVLVSTVGGELSVVDLVSGEKRVLGLGDDPVWRADGREVVASQRVFEGDRLRDIRLVSFALDGGVRVVDVGPGLWPRQPALGGDGETLLFVDELTGRVHRVHDGEARPLTLPPAEDRVEVPMAPFRQLAVAPRGILVIRGVPYHHQVHDTPAWFDGSGACGATSATMAIQYYEVLPDWGVLATSPFDHTSHFGSYVAEVYTHGGYSYNVFGDGGYGGHGWIWQDNGLGTKENMRSYIAQHGLSSPSVDWSPTFAELQAEVAARTPFVLLSSITAAGHYTTVTGYVEGQHTVHFNDPYGNKNEGYSNYNGAGVGYDWPGYNNGYENLNTVWCYVYARGNPPAQRPGTVDDPIVVASFPYTDVNTTRTSNGTDEFDSYSCAPAVDEQGREITYRFTVPVSGQLDVEVACDHEVDVDVHLLSAPDPGTCLRRAHVGFSEWVEAGTYWLTCDTYRSAGTDLMGDYTLGIAFAPDADVIFSDGFESGDTTRWSGGPPPP